MLIREILEESVQKFGEVKAVKWINRKEVLERSYSEMLRNVISIRKGLLAEDFAGKHLSLIHIWQQNVLHRRTVSMWDLQLHTDIVWKR